MFFDRATKPSRSWEVEPPDDRTMLALQYLVAFVAVAARPILLSSLH